MEWRKCLQMIQPTGSQYPKNKNSKSKYTCTAVFRATLFTITKAWRQAKCPSIDDWVRKKRDIHTYISHTHTHTHTHIHRLAYDSVIKKNECNAATWMDLENVTLSEVSQTEKYKYYTCMLGCSSHVQVFVTLDGSPPGFSIHGILQARVVERVAMPSSRGSSQPRD